MAEPEQDERVAVAGDTVTLFREGGEVRLVLDDDPGGQPFLEGGDQAAVPLGQAGGVAQFAGGGVDEAGGSDADRVQALRPGLLGRAFDQRDRLLDGGTGAGVVRDGHRRPRQFPAEEVGDDDRDALGADVEGGELGPVGDDPVQTGVGAAALLPGLPHHVDQSGGREAFDEVGDGGPGQPRELLQLPCRQGAFLLEQAQGDAVVDGPGGAR